MRDTIEQVADAKRFNMVALYERAWPIMEGDIGVVGLVPALRERLGDDYRRLGCAVLRNVFLIELVKTPKIDSTKFRVRWCQQLEGDQRWCPFEECLAIAVDLLAELAGVWFDSADHAEVFRLSTSHPLLPYEAPLDYLERPLLTDSTTRIHRRGNLSWVCNDIMLRTLRLRQFLTTADTSPDAVFFSKVLNDKIYVKTYLTDRVLTGRHKTNREKWWETHPHSVHFANRRTCLAIEYTLITQLCAFERFPEEARRILQTEGTLPAEVATTRCPVTLDPLSFPAFREELMNPVHGKSNFQVGHLNPLKLDDPNDAASGHTAENTSWVSADGNRVQGSMSLSQVRTLLLRIARNYEAQGWA
jgi:hypothetical protein